MPEGAEMDAIRFYEGVLGLTQVPKPAHLAARGGCWFESGEVRLHLGVEAGFRPARKAHPALMVDDLGALIDRLEEADIEIVRDQPLPGFDRIYVSDPFGNRLELVELLG
jgi:catechol 2,3-dioxygenase-like lactoylglutathione lyase family enzyme